MFVSLLLTLAFAAPHGDALVRVSANHLDDAQALGLDVWSEHPRTSFDARIKAADRPRLDASGVPYVVLIDDLGPAVEAERLRLRSGGTQGGGGTPDPQDFFDEYQPLDRIEARLDELAQLRPDRVTALEIGRSFEDRPIHALEVTAAEEDARVILINAGQHAREWIAVASTTCILDRLVTEAEDPRVDTLLQTFRFVVVPVVNPDGYVYSWTDDRYWRKTRRPPHGVDLNRNFSASWGGPGSSDNPEAGNYHGESPLSEPESQAVEALAQERPVFAHLDVHAFGQLVLYPWGHDGALPPDHDVLQEGANVLADGFSTPYDEPYTPLSGSDFYPAAGNIMDWSYAQWGAYAYGIELRPQSDDEGGFVIPPTQIEPVCDELWSAVLDFSEHVTDADPLNPVDPPKPVPPDETSTGPDDTGDTDAGDSSSSGPIQGTGSDSDSDSTTTGANSSTADPDVFRTSGGVDGGRQASEPAQSEGCGCTSSSSNRAPMALWLLVLLGIRRRRTFSQHFDARRHQVS